MNWLDGVMGDGANTTECIALSSEFELTMYGSGLTGAPVSLMECLLQRCQRWIELTPDSGAKCH